MQVSGHQRNVSAIYQTPLLFLSTVREILNITGNTLAASEANGLRFDTLDLRSKASFLKDASTPQAGTDVVGFSLRNAVCVNSTPKQSCN